MAYLVYTGEAGLASFLDHISEDMTRPLTIFGEQASRQRACADCIGERYFYTLALVFLVYAYALTTKIVGYAQGLEGMSCRLIYDWTFSFVVSRTAVICSNEVVS